MSSAGPNDSCPCGSGREYSQCCGERADRQRALVAGAARESALAKLLTYAFHPSFDNDHAVAELLFWGDRIRDPSAPEFTWIIDSEDATIKYNTWFLFDWEIDDSGTVVELFLEEAGDKLSPPERDYLLRVSNAPLRLFEVERVLPGVGADVVDLWTGARLFVTERTATEQMVVWDLLGARIAPDGTGANVFEGGLYLYPAEAKDRILREFRRLSRRHQRKYPLDESRAFFRRYGQVFNHLWLELVAFREPAQLVTTDGDPLVFCRAIFDTDAAERLRGLLQGHADIRVSDDALIWRQPGADGERVLGTWFIEERRVVLETTSQRRCARGREWLQAVAGDLVRYRATALETVDEAFQSLRQSAPPRRDPLLSDADRDANAGAVRDLYDQHYAEWLDRPEPALGNRTPRAAARTRLWRTKVTDLLKQQENSSQRASRQGRPAYDFSWIWRELGLERPRSG